MKVTKLLAIASVVGVIAANLVTASALAWEPKGVIKKYVQNQTTASELADANDANSAVNAKPGDTLKYVIEIRNDGAKHDKGWNDMHFTRLTDTLPAGVELINDPTKREIVEDIGLIKAGERVTKEYLLKVTSDKDATVIENKACFTGDSEAKDQPQKGCDTATVKITIPKEEPPKEQPKEEPKQETPQVQGTQTNLPETGASTLIAPAAAIGSGALAYAGRLFVLKRRQY